MPPTPPPGPLGSPAPAALSPSVYFTFISEYAPVSVHAGGALWRRLCALATAGDWLEMLCEASTLGVAGEPLAAVCPESADDRPIPVPTRHTSALVATLIRRRRSLAVALLWLSARSLAPLQLLALLPPSLGAHLAAALAPASRVPRPLALPARTAQTPGLQCGASYWPLARAEEREEAHSITPDTIVVGLAVISPFASACRPTWLRLGNTFTLDNHARAVRRTRAQTDKVEHRFGGIA